ncbi:hypothetical protein [Actinokineospora sp. HUAS TT18]|uniref:hypothetical protein n=1 Tax=Actinokineospora sp. HUAS TT18 TaxID=3447451 RepID=UPI003F52400C
MSVAIAEVDWITCVDDGMDHGVFVAHRAQEGLHRTLCGSSVVEAPEACVPRPPCPACARALSRPAPRASWPRRWLRG